MNAVAAPLSPLDWKRLPLTGRTLIEASAGTGKTFNIGLVYLRLLLEQKLSIEKILVTTFTDAAAQELRERLRQRLVEVEHWLSGSRVATNANDDESLENYLAKRYASETDAKAALRLIQIARSDFDRAPIATFHALCQRIQHDFPLESGVGFASGTLLDEKALLRECVEDFWRRRYLIGEIDEREAEAILAAGPEGLQHDLSALLSHDAFVIPTDGMAEVDVLFGALKSADNVSELRRMAADKGLYASRKNALSNRLEEIAELLEADSDVLELLADDGGKIFELKGIEDQQAPNIKLIDMPLINLLYRMRLLLKHHDIFARGSVLMKALAFCREEIPKRARQRDAQTFQMLIDNVHSRLCSDRDGPIFAKRLFESFSAALIDEFQDTDRRQFEIFDRIFREDDGTTRGSLIMIGDPKQAIFGFRGGDIAAYLRASSEVTRRYSLVVNHRSSSALVTAVNALYAHTDGGFRDARIRYQQVTAAGSAHDKAYSVSDSPVSTPLVIHRFRSAVDESANNLGDLETLALQDCSNRIAELLNDPKRTVDGRAIGPGDIAVLLATNNQISALRKLLVDRRVPCVSGGRGNVFDSEVARELELILYAVLNADDDRAVRGALSTHLLGARFADVFAWQSDTAAFERELERFVHWRVLVRTRGVLALIGALLEDRGANLLAAPDGERTLTDLRHLGELLADEEVMQHGLEGLYAWFVSMRRDEKSSDESGDAADAKRLRIESDTQRVQLLTIHGSKGLEFPIVFLPLVWRISSRENKYKPKVLRFHEDGSACVDLGSANFGSNYARHFREDLQERLRLLYVALTRAKYAVHVYWVDRGRRLDCNDQLWEIPAIDVLIHKAQESFGLAKGEDSLDALVAKLDGIRVAEPYASAKNEYRAQSELSKLLATPRPTPTLRVFEWLHSFSSLTRQAQLVDIESAAVDESEVDPTVDLEQAAFARAGEPENDELLELYPLRGPRFGNAVHNILEQAKPGKVWPEQRLLIDAQSNMQAVRADGEIFGDPSELIGRLVDRVRHADLGEGLRLIDLTSKTRVSEFEFQFPLRHVSVSHLREICATHGCANAVPITLQTVALNGMLTGFVDLVFFHAGRYHVLDYKTNWLGSRLSDYQGTTLDSAMNEHHYELQALLYTVALHRYLGGRLDGYEPEKHLGETWYLFLRAVGLQQGAGIWRRQWPMALILALDYAFAGDVEVAA
jgi:exodeoxyribonuclease V beta subunit